MNFKRRILSSLACLIAVVMMLSFSLPVFAEVGVGNISVSDEMNFGSDNIDVEPMSVVEDYGISTLAETEYTTHFNKNGIGAYEASEGYDFYIDPNYFWFSDLSSLVAKKGNKTYDLLNGSGSSLSGCPFRYKIVDDASTSTWKDCKTFTVVGGILYETGEVTGGKVSLSGWSIVVGFKEAVVGPNGNLHGATMTISSITRATNGSKPKNPILMSGLDATYMSAASSNNVKTAYRYAVNISINGASSGSTFMAAFADLDRPSLSGTYEFDWSDGFQESVKMYGGKGWVGRKVSMSADHKLKVTGQKDADPIFFSTEATNEDEELLSGFSFLGSATGTKFAWSGTGCRTLLGVKKSELTRVTGTIKFMRRKANGDWTAESSKFTDTYPKGLKATAFWQCDPDHFENLTDDEVLKIYDFKGANTLLSPAPTASNGLSLTKGDNYVKGGFLNRKMTSDLTAVIQLERKRYTYAFDANLPDGKSGSDIGNMQSDLSEKWAETKSLAVSAVKSPTLKGYVFKGWNTKKDGTGSGYLGTESMLSDKTFLSKVRKKTLTSVS